MNTPFEPHVPDPIKFFFEDCARTQAILAEVPKMADALKSSLSVSYTEGLQKFVSWRFSIRTPEMKPGSRRFRLSKKAVAPSKEVSHKCDIYIEQRVSELPHGRPGFSLLFWIAVRFPKEHCFPSAFLPGSEGKSLQVDRSGLGLYFSFPERWKDISPDALSSFLAILLRLGEVKDALISYMEERLAR